MTDVDPGPPMVALDCHDCGRAFLDQADSDAGQVHVYCAGGCGKVHGRNGRGGMWNWWALCPSCEEARDRKGGS